MQLFYVFRISCFRKTKMIWLDFVCKLVSETEFSEEDSAESHKDETRDRSVKQKTCTYKNRK